MQNNYLFHHGVKGQRWGVRKKTTSSGGRKRRNISDKEKETNRTLSKREKYIQQQLELHDETLEERKARIRASQINVGKSYLKENAMVFATIPVTSVAIASSTGLGALGALGAGAVGVSLATLGGAYKIAKNTKKVYYS